MYYEWAAKEKVHSDCETNNYYQIIQWEVEESNTSRVIIAEEKEKNRMDVQGLVAD